MAAEALPYRGCTSVHAFPGASRAMIVTETSELDKCFYNFLASRAGHLLPSGVSITRLKSPTANQYISCTPVYL